MDVKTEEKVTYKVLRIFLNEISWNIVRNECEDWLEISYMMITPQDETYNDELYINCDKWGTDSTDLEISKEQIKLILDGLNKRYKLWEFVSKEGYQFYQPIDKGMDKITIITCLEFGRLTPEAIKYIKEEYFSMPVQIL